MNRRAHQYTESYADQDRKEHGIDRGNAKLCISPMSSLRRIRKARELMETTGKSIYEIAIECGFPNSSNFYRLYRKHTGESPRQGRQEQTAVDDFHV